MSELHQGVPSGAKRRVPLHHNEPQLPEHDDMISEKSETTNISPSQKCETHKETVTVKNHMQWLYLLLVVIIGICVGYTMLHHNKKSEIDKEHELKQKLRKLLEVFPSQNKDVWYQFLSGIKRVSAANPMEPAVFLLLHDGGDDTLTCLSKEVGLAAMTFLNASSSDLLVLKGEELRRGNSDDFGWMIEVYRPQVEEHRTMVVHNLEKIPAVLAQSFHVMCDEVTPLVDKAVYFFTMDVPGIASTANIVLMAEKTLKALWGKQLTENILEPLIVRMTGNVMFIKSENDLSKDCSFYTV